MSEANFNIIVSISEIVLCLCLIMLSVFLIISVKKFLISIAQIENKMTKISDRLLPVISDMKLITDDIKEISDRSRVQFDMIENISTSLTKKGISLLNTINKIENVSQGLTLNVSNLVYAVLRGVKTFGNKLKNGSVKEIVSTS